MNQQQISGIFHKTFNGEKNFLTPNVDRYFKKGGHVVELSHGRGMSGGKMWAVTVLRLDGEKTQYSEGGFETEQLALDYLDEINLKDL